MNRVSRRRLVYQESGGGRERVAQWTTVWRSYGRADDDGMVSIRGVARPLWFPRDETAESPVWGVRARPFSPMLRA